MAAIVHYRAGQMDRMSHRGDPGHRAGRACPPVHDRGIHFIGPLPRKHRSTSGVEQGIVFQQDDRGLDRLQRIAAAGENFGTGIQRGL